MGPLCGLRLGQNASLTLNKNNRIYTVNFQHAKAKVQESRVSLCGSVGKDFVYHACGHEFESRLK